MEDGRTYASYQPEAVVNERIQQQNNINTNWKYRQFLTHNGNTIMKLNTSEACYTLGLPTHVTSNTTPSSNVPFIYKSTFDTEKPGYGYSSSDLKNPYLSRVELQARLISPSFPSVNFSNK